MKKSKLILITALALLVSMLLSSCMGGKKTLDISEALDENAHYEKSYRSATTATLLDELESLSLTDELQSLCHFSGIDEYNGVLRVKHIVYNASTGKIVYNEAETPSKTISVKLASVDNTYNTECFTVTVKEWNLGTLDEQLSLKSNTVTLYDSNGTAIDSSNGGSVTINQNFLCFNGKCYSAKGSELNYEFDYSPLAKLPAITAESENYYYEFNSTSGNAYILVYDKSMQQVANYTYPTFARNISFVPLENGNAFIQYLRFEEENAKDYTFYYNESKYTLFTEIFDVEKGKTDDIDCDYLIMNGQITKLNEDLGLDSEILPVLALGTPIEDKYCSLSSRSFNYVTIDEDGKITELELLNGTHITGISLIADGYWKISTDNSSYIMNANGDVLGEITNAKFFNDYLTADGKVFNYDLELVYDFSAAGFSLQRMMPNALLLNNSNGDLFVYSGGEPVKIMAKEEGYELYKTYNNLIVILNDSDPNTAAKYEFYNENGAKLLTVEENIYNEYSGFIVEAYADGASLISTRNDKGIKIYYSFS